MAKVLDFIKQIFKGKTIYRILFNWQVKESCKNLSGEVLDLASGLKPSYYHYLSKGLNIVRAEYRAENSPDIILDLNKPLPFSDESIKNIFLFNVIYIIKNRKELLKEIRRVLKQDGQLFLSSPLIANEMPEPNDYCRLTYEGLETELKEAGFEEIKIIRLGERFSSAANLLHPAWLFNIIRFFVYSVSLFLDKIIPRSITEKHPCPSGYFCIVKKTKNL